MAKRVKIGRKELLEAIESVILENKTFLKVGNGGQNVPPPAPPMGQMPPEQDPMMTGQMDQMGGMGGPNGEMDPSMDPNAMGGGDENQFDTNFDAGVEADEDSDPKTYIQQLTGKLSQSLNSFNNEQGPDAGLNKYVASMIVAAACKNLDEKAKKEIIEKINSAQSDTEEEMPSDGDLENGDMGEEPEEGGNGQDPVMEGILTKKQLQELAFGVQPRQENLPIKTQEKPKSIFGGKTFMK